VPHLTTRRPTLLLPRLDWHIRRFSRSPPSSLRKLFCAHLSSFSGPSERLCCPRASTFHPFSLLFVFPQPKRVKYCQWLHAALVCVSVIGKKLDPTGGFSRCRSSFLSSATTLDEQHCVPIGEQRGENGSMPWTGRERPIWRLWWVEGLVLPPPPVVTAERQAMPGESAPGAVEVAEAVLRCHPPPHRRTTRGKPDTCEEVNAQAVPKAMGAPTPRLTCGRTSKGASTARVELRGDSRYRSPQCGLCRGRVSTACAAGALWLVALCCQRQVLSMKRTERQGAISVPFCGAELVPSCGTRIRPTVACMPSTDVLFAPLLRDGDEMLLFQMFPPQKRKSP